uniref:Uncharacterized protein n=1 Tax=viral metagenome TaxID=1070528 RepID=A0A6C0M5Q5_9ZZZZ
MLYAFIRSGMYPTTEGTGVIGPIMLIPPSASSLLFRVCA